MPNRPRRSRLPSRLRRVRWPSGFSLYSSFKWEFELLQTELLARCQQAERFANTPFPGLRPLGRVNPNDKVTALGWWQLPKRLPGFGVGLDRFRVLRRRLANGRARPAAS